MVVATKRRHEAFPNSDVGQRGEYGYTLHRQHVGTYEAELTALLKAAVGTANISSSGLQAQTVPLRESEQE